MAALLKQEELYRYWKQFVERGALEDDRAVRPAVLRSWKRSRQAGVDPFASVMPVPSPRSVQKLRSENAALLELAGPVIRDLNEFVRGSGFVTVLTDRQGRVLEVAGDRDSLAYARSIHMVPGSDWGEAAAGTSAFALALAEGQPVQVIGCEHYVRHLHELTCSAAPIHDGEGHIIGILDMSGPYHLVHSHTLGMVVAAARSIERELRLTLATAEVRRSAETLEAVVDSMREALLVLDHQGRVIRANSQAGRLLGRAPLALAGQPAQELLGAQPCLAELLQAGRGFTDEEITVVTDRQDVHCLASARSIPLEQGARGYLLTLQEVRQVSRLVNRMQGGARFSFDDLLGVSQAMERVKRDARRAAQSDLTVLILGESGTGKELLAHSIHNASGRRDGPFVAINCGAIPRELLESELFGYDPGAFTGALRQGRPGKFELADGGTLFLDEIGDMPLAMQASLLRVLQERRVTRVGGSRVIPVDVRVIAATNRDLAAEVRAGNFRMDLLYRLDVLTIRVPPLRERPMDILFLFEQLLARHGGARRLQLSEAAREALSRYEWPGNVRELENVVAKCVSLVEGSVINLSDLPAAVRGADAGPGTPGGGLPDDRPLMDMAERKAIEEACWQAGGNLSRAARILGISRPTLYRKMKLYGIGRAPVC